MSDELRGTFACPICGLDRPHSEDAHRLATPEPQREDPGADDEEKSRGWARTCCDAPPTVPASEHQRLEAGAAAMRKALELMLHSNHAPGCAHSDGCHIEDAVNAALSSDAGKGWVSPEEHRTLLDAERAGRRQAWAILWVHSFKCEQMRERLGTSYDDAKAAYDEAVASEVRRAVEEAVEKERKAAADRIHAYRIEWPDSHDLLDSLEDDVRSGGKTE